MVRLLEQKKSEDVEGQKSGKKRGFYKFNQLIKHKHFLKWTLKQNFGYNFNQLIKRKHLVIECYPQKKK